MTNTPARREPASLFAGLEQCSLPVPSYLYQAGMPLALLTEWLGHADPETTLIYAHADTEMKRQALEKANSATSQSPLPVPLWHDREDIIQRLCGLKE